MAEDSWTDPPVTIYSLEYNDQGVAVVEIETQELTTCEGDDTVELEMQRPVRFA